MQLSTGVGGITIMEPIIQNLIVPAFFTKEEPAKVFEQPLRPIDYRALEFVYDRGEPWRSSLERYRLVRYRGVQSFFERRGL